MELGELWPWSRLCAKHQAVDRWEMPSPGLMPRYWLLVHQTYFMGLIVLLLDIISVPGGWLSIGNRERKDEAIVRTSSLKSDYA